MKQLIIIMAILLLHATNTQAAVLIVREAINVQGATRLFETADELLRDVSDPPSKPPNATVEDCLMKVATTRCYVDGGTYYAERGVPLLPPSLLSFVQEGKILDRDTLTYKREKFLRHIKKFAFDGNEKLLQPMDNDWAVGEYFNWVNVERDEDARDLLRVWRQIEGSLQGTPVGEHGLMMLRVSHPGNLSSLQICWYFYAFDDPTVAKCKAVVMNRGGKTYVRYLRSLYSGGYSYEPPLAFLCKGDRPTSKMNLIKAYTRAMADLFKGAPFSVDKVERMKKSSEEAENSQERLFVTKLAGMSSIFASYRETVYMSVEIDSFDEGIASITVDPDIFLTKQNIALLTEIPGPSKDQDKHYKTQIKNAITKLKGCMFDEEVATEEL